MSYFSFAGKFNSASRLLLALWLVPNFANAQIAPVQPQPSVPDIFAVRTWVTPLPESEVAKDPAPKRPQAPLLPFRFVGKIADPDKPLAFLLGRGGRILSVSVGDVIDSAYLVEKYERAHLYFIYKPMRARQSLFVGGTS